MAFLSDELEQAFNSTTNAVERIKQVGYVLIARIPKPDVGVDTFLNTLKGIDSSYKYFCKRHPEFKEDGFRNIILNKVDIDSNREKFKKALGW